MKAVVFALSLAIAGTGAATSANAVGCLSGAVVGGVAGHMAHHHAVLGAAAGCAVGHHMAVVSKRKKIAAKQAAMQDHQAMAMHH